MIKILIDQRFWHPNEPRISRKLRTRGLSIRLWRIRGPLPGFERDVVWVLHLVPVSWRYTGTVWKYRFRALWRRLQRG